MRTFFLGDTAISDDTATVTGELYHHMARVLRLKTGSGVTLTDTDGACLSGVIEEVGTKSLSVRITGRKSAPEQEQALRITLYQGLPKGEKLDLILQKCTELGAAELVTFDADRSVVKLLGERGAARLKRSERIVQEAARQSGRCRAPKVTIGGTLDFVLRDARQSVKLLLWEGERTTRLRETFEAHPDPGSVGVVVGPEGGLTLREVERAIAYGFTPVSAGPRILRTETAGLAILSILQFYWGDIG